MKLAPDPAPSQLLWLEAVNFDSVIFDVDDLAAIRGGGEAMLALPELIIGKLREKLGATSTIRPIYHAASQALVRIESDSDKNFIATALDEILRQFDAKAATKLLENKLRRPDAKLLLPLLIAQLTFAVGLKPVSDNEAADLAAVETAARVAQMQRLSVDIPATGAPGSQRPCRHDWVRPRNAEYFLPDAQGPDDVAELSHSMALRRCLGRSGRRVEFYQRIIGHSFAPTCGGYANDFNEIVEKSNGDTFFGDVPGIIRNKMAVIWIDANGMGALRNGLVTDFASAERFANQVLELRAQFLKAFVEWASKQPYLLLTSPRRQKVDNERHIPPILRLETLAWGADECMFVLPAWAIEPVLIKLKELLAADMWPLKDELGEQLTDADGKPLVITHGIGVAITSHKAPIREVKKLADALASAAKVQARDRNVLQYMASGSVDMPTRELKAERQALYKIPEAAQAAAFTLPLDHIDAIFTAVARIKGESGNTDNGVPRDKIADILGLIHIGELTASGVAKKVGEIFELMVGEKAITRNYLDQANQSITVADILGCMHSASVTGAEHAPLVHLLELWPYAGLGLPTSVIAP